MLRVPARISSERTQQGAEAVRTAQSAFDLNFLESSVGYLLRRAQLELSRQFMHTVGTRNGIRPGAFGALVLASANPGIDQMQIATMLGLDKANVASLIRDLVRGGWLARRRVARDRRCQGVFLTPGGVGKLAALKREIRDLDQSFCRSLSDSERTTLVRLLARVCFGPAASEDVGAKLSAREISRER